VAGLIGDNSSRLEQAEQPLGVSSASSALEQLPNTAGADDNWEATR